MGEPTWKVHVPGVDPERDEIIARRFGQWHDKPRRRSSMLSCASWECQVADKCQAVPTHPESTNG